MKHDNIKSRTGAEMRAIRDQRLAAQSSPAAEAVRREASFLRNLTGARDDYRWIVENQAWRHLGHDTYTAWYVARVQPIMQALGAKPTPELAADVIQRVRSDDSALPSAQRHSRRELAALSGAGEWTVRSRNQDRPARRTARVADLDTADDQERSPAAFTPSQRTAEEPAATFVDAEPAPEPELCPTCRQPIPNGGQSE